MQTNIIGTNNVINSSIKANVSRVVFTSSDKAVNPSSTMGATKLLGERLMTAANQHSGGHMTIFSSVRFGNVLDSNGSVLQIFRNQIGKNIPLTVTSTNMTRFFITMSQALQLCLHAAEEMIGGEIFVMSMGSCNIMSLASAVCGNDEFKYDIIGQKPGEKEHEELVTDSESVRTVCKGHYYIILPEMRSIMDVTIVDKYKKVYKNPTYLCDPLRSDKNMLSDSEVIELLTSEKLI